MKTSSILFIISFSLLIIIFAIEFGIEKIETETKCYDRYRNEIKNLICYEKKFKYEGLDAIQLLCGILFVLLYTIGIMYYLKEV